METWLLGALRLGHALSAAVWLGGTLTYALVVSARAVEISSAAWRPLREALRAGIWVFLVSGAILTMDRLSSAGVPPIYFGLLGLKVVLGLWMFSAARSIGASTALSAETVWWHRKEWQIVLVSVAVYGLAFGLRAIYEQTLRG
jgi:hypothetical protein